MGKDDVHVPPAAAVKPVAVYVKMTREEAEAAADIQRWIRDRLQSVPPRLAAIAIFGVIDSMPAVRESGAEMAQESLKAKLREACEEADALHRQNCPHCAKGVG